jgi:hypothetical protein
MAAAQELLINLFVAWPAVRRRHVRCYHEPVMLPLLLALCRLVAVQAGNAFHRVFAHFIFVDHGVLLVCMAFRAFSRGLQERRVGLVRFDARAGMLNQKRA